jgi:poly(beta-D-mannuronate) lyase
MNAVPNPLASRYHQVDNALIENNRFVRCDHIEFGVGADFERTVSPVNTVVKNNLFCYPEKSTVIETHTDISGIKFIDNKVVASASINKTGFHPVKLESEPSCVFPVRKEDCGASWHIEKPVDNQRTEAGKILIKAEQNSLINAVKNLKYGDTVYLENNARYFIDEPVVINKLVFIRPVDLKDSLPVIRYNGKSGQRAMITIADNGILNISGVEFSGNPSEGNARPMAGIAPAAEMGGTYSAVIENCVFNYFEESFSAGFKALKNSFADSLTFVNCKFHNISGEGIALGAEKNDDGKYSAENIVIENCYFNNILGCAVNIYRGGNDESTHGPSLYMDNCNFDLSSNQERGATLRLIGVQTAHLKNLTFTNSGRGGAAIKFDECRWDDIQLSNIRYENSGKLRMNRLYQQQASH